MKITVAICTWNRCESLRQTLQEMCSLEIPAGVEWELVVVDNNSTDDTRHVVETFMARLPIRYVFEPVQGLSHARNRAVAEANGEYILWTDDDVLVSRNWMEAYVSAFKRHPEAAFFGGPVEPWFEGEPPKWLAETAIKLLGGAFAVRDLGRHERQLGCGEDDLPFGANYALRMDWQRRYQYDVRLGVKGAARVHGEETRLLEEILKDGGQGYWVPEALVRHWIPKIRQTTAYVWRYYFGAGRTEFLLSYPFPEVPAAKLWFGVPRWTWRAVVENTVRYALYRLTRPPEVWVPALARMARTWGFWYECWRQRGRAKDE
jgi:glycosyltransferase involved in cell wall biosynthesis